MAAFEVITEDKENPMHRSLLLSALVFFVVLPLMAQDPVKVDAKHYKVDMENN